MKIERHHDARPGNSFSRWLAGLMVAVGVLMGTMPVASAETRTLKLFFIHTKERAEITFKRNGRYDAAGLAKINKFLRDWRRNEPTKMDPRLLDLVWETYRASGARDYIHVVSAYRSPRTNSMLRSRSKGVATKSQHMLGKAMDFYIPGVSLKTLRNNGLKMQVGGVGYYPRSGSPFVHLDVGNVRHWPRMSRKELVSVFPNGKTLHVPSDGKPLPGFEQAMASYKSRKGSGSVAVAYANTATGKSGGKGLFATLFGGGGGADEAEESGGSVEVAAAEPPAAKPAKVAAPVVAKPVPVKPAAVAQAKQPAIEIVPPELARPASMARPAEEMAPMVEEPVADQPLTPEMIIASLAPRNVPRPSFAQRAQPLPVTEPLQEAMEAPAIPVEPQAQADELLAAAPAALEPETAQAPAEVALNIPVPSWRPARSLPPTLAADEDPKLLALVAAEPDAIGGLIADDPAAPVPGLRPAEVAAEPVAEQAASTMELFALPQPRPQTATQAAELPAEAILPAEARRTTDRLAALEASTAVVPELRRARAETDPSPTASVRTTKKAARPSADVAKPERKPVRVAAQPKTARWALYGDPVAKNTKGTTAPSLAYNIVRTAPAEVYTEGFQRSAEAAPTNQFSGKAVKFLSVARFATN